MKKKNNLTSQLYEFKERLRKLLEHFIMFFIHERRTTYYEK